MTDPVRPVAPREDAIGELMTRLEARSRQFHAAEQKRTGTFEGKHGSWMGRVYTKWEECPSHPCCSDVKLLQSLAAAPVPCAASPADKGCINCGETNDGGYMTGFDGDVDEGAVGPFCSQCWEFLRENFVRATGEGARDEEAETDVSRMRRDGPEPAPSINGDVVDEARTLPEVSRHRDDRHAN